MKIEVTNDERQFREEVRAWLADNVPKERRPTEGEAAAQFDRQWVNRQYLGGWSGIAWPKEFGGRGESLGRQMIWLEEYARAGAPEIGNFFVAIAHAGPTIMARGTPQQQQFHLPRILSGASIWCQGFSEPGAGSDLAGISTRGVIEGDEIVVNGSKIWTSYAHVADFQELLIRTDPSSGRHKGLTWAICDMSLPGIEVRPIRSMAGHHEFNQVFYDNVRIPLRNVVGTVDDGWNVAMATLGFERGTGIIVFQVELARRLEELVEQAKASGAIRDMVIADRLLNLRAELHALRAMTLMNISRSDRNGALGAEATLVAVYHAEMEKKVARMAFELAGNRGLEATPGKWSVAYEYYNSFAHTIAGGTSEIRRNIIGERVLGLPRGR